MGHWSNPRGEDFDGTHKTVLRRLLRKSRMRRESHVRFCGGLGVKFPRATRRVMTLVQLGREVPELDADVFFTEMEL